MTPQDFERWLLLFQWATQVSPSLPNTCRAPSTRTWQNISSRTDAASTSHSLYYYRHVITQPPPIFFASYKGCKMCSCNRSTPLVQATSAKTAELLAHLRSQEFPRSSYQAILVEGRGANTASYWATVLQIARGSVQQRDAVAVAANGKNDANEAKQL